MYWIFGFDILLQNDSSTVEPFNSSRRFLLIISKYKDDNKCDCRIFMFLIFFFPNSCIIKLNANM